MKRFALFAFATTALAACETPSGPTQQTPSLEMPSLAKISNEKIRVSGLMLNSCPPAEFVQVEGWMHRVITGEVTPTSTDIKVHLNTQGIKGVGVTSGDRYIVAQNAKNDIEYSDIPPVFSFEEQSSRFRMVRLGSADNYYFTETFRITYPPLLFETLRYEIECRG